MADTDAKYEASKDKRLILSPSNISIYTLCPFAYYLRYIEHERVPVSLNLVFGSEIHKMLKEFYKKDFKSSESFVNYWRHRWKSAIAGDFLKGKEKELLNTRLINYNLKKEDGSIEIKIGDHIRFLDDELKGYFSYRNLGDSILRRFYERHKGKNDPVHTEKRFSFDFRSFKIRGVIDRIDRNEKGVYITDYKTDKSNPKENPSLLHNNVQLTIYSAAYRSIFREDERAILFYHLRSGDAIITKRSDKDFDCLEKICETVSENILKENFVPHYGSHCKFCDYIQPCNGYSYNNEGPIKIEDNEIKNGADIWNFIDQEF